ncbi:MAG TPA: DUF2235 domain-containing protein [Terriglobales bacterium]|nr:DUF2235 domain-containing protein [Terriglobales bacterium]HTT21684.1 DUF2235 domain-containing protein [Candidatus Sulfotelmatobacter sp.]
MTGQTRRLVVCFDGTWNTDRSNTNVSRLFRKIADENSGCRDQRRFYDEGVGTKLGERIQGGMLGMGLDRNIRQGWAWLGSQFPLTGELGFDDAGFVKSPDIFVFGFSRGAFTARSLGGLINYLGVPRLDASKPPDSEADLHEYPVVLNAWELYAARPTKADRDQVLAGRASDTLKTTVAEHDANVAKFRKDCAIYPVRIHFMGVWDTVGALGIPRVLDYPWIPRPSTKYQFHDTQLGRCVRFAYHAVAIDEQRESYCVTLWTDTQPTTEAVEQRWFPGAHADVGGGYEDDLLPDPPLAWIALKAADHGLHFVNDRGDIEPVSKEILPSVARPPAAFDLDGREYLSPVHDSYAEFMGGMYRVLRSLPGASGRVFRRMLVVQDGIGQTVDATAYQKLDADLYYRPPNLAQAGRLDVNYALATLDTGETERPAQIQNATSNPSTGTS